MNDKLTLYIEREAQKMAKNQIVKQDTGLKIYAPIENPEDKFAGIPTAGNFLPLFKHNYVGGCFDVPDEPPRIPEFEALVIHLAEGLRRNFESIYRAGQDPTPPTCFSVDGIHGSRPQTIREFKAVGRKSIYGECKTCFYSQFKSALAWQDHPDQKDYGKGVQCSNYVLAFLLQVLVQPEFDKEDGELLKPGVYRPIILQIPPTSVSVVSYNLAHWVGQDQRATLYNLVWKFVGTGGTKPRSNNTQAINVLPIRGALQDEVKHLKELQSTMQDQIQDMCNRFASGGDLSQPTAGSTKEEPAEVKAGSAEI